MRERSWMNRVGQRKACQLWRGRGDALVDQIRVESLNGALPAAIAVVTSMLFSCMTGFADVVTPFGKAAMAERY